MRIPLYLTLSCCGCGLGNPARKSEGGAIAAGLVHSKVHLELLGAYPDYGVSYDLSARCSEFGAGR